ncbi:MAG: chemotaxis protein CheB [Cyanobacteriota bacterium]|jgi:two-component system CheB/CheR fusion protein
MVGSPSSSASSGPAAGPIGHLVGIGASAGGLGALQELVGQLGGGAGVAYVVAQHLSPDHRSQLVELLARSTSLRVVTAKDGEELQPGVIAVAPPNHDIAVDGQRLRVMEPVPRFGPSPGIDLLFDSIAEHWQHRGVAVVLSGTGSDGARGLRVVRAAGGLTIAQTPESARFDAMPRAAITLGGADLVLNPVAIGERLRSLSSSGEDWISSTVPDSEPALLSSVTTQLRHSTGIDFSQYKESTVRRQVQRRMAIRQVSNFEDYLPLLAADKGEAQALLQNLLVTVTSFFRDPRAFAALGECITNYLEHQPEGQSLRFWVPGCATGEEAYSLAMLVSSLLGYPADISSRLKIFGTDLDEQSLACAREGVYPVSAAKAIPEELRRHFLPPDARELVIPDNLRNCVLFARHNVVEDPPFPRLDLISCRNTLIYFNPPLQERVLSLFHFGLTPGGLLFLGESEALGNRAPGFSLLDGEHRIYRRTSNDRPRLLPSMALSLARNVPLPQPPSRGGGARESVPEQHVALLAAVLRSLCRPSLVLDESHDLIEVIGDVTSYCRLPEGRITAAAGAFLRPELQPEARALFLLVRPDGAPVLSQTLTLEGVATPFRLEVRPLQVNQRLFCLLSFVPEVEPDAPSDEVIRMPPRDPAFDREIERLERELITSQNSLRSSLAELEQANEELEASSEELQASSEELQSSNEELEASNEELQATNEELGTLNQQLRSRSEELLLLNNDLENIQASLSQGMVIVDRDLKVTRFTPLAVRVFALVEADIGQSLLSVPTTVPLPGLREALLAVLSGEPRRILEASSEDIAYLTQVLPYQIRDGERIGAIVTLTDVSELVALRRAAEASLNEFTRLTDSLEQAVWKWDGSMARLLYVSRRVHSLTGWTPAELLARPTLLEEAIDPLDREAVAMARNQSVGRWSVRYRFTTHDGRRIWLHETACRTECREEGEESFVVGTFADATAQHELEEHAKDLSAIFESVFHTELVAVVVLDDQFRVVMANQRFSRLVGYETLTIPGMPFEMFLPPEQEQRLKQVALQLRDQPAQPTPCPLTLNGRDGSSSAVQAEIAALPRRFGKAVLRLILTPRLP